MKWRRSFAEPPPPISSCAPLQQAIKLDERYRRQCCPTSGDGGASHDVVVPRGEAFSDCPGLAVVKWRALRHQLSFEDGMGSAVLM